MTNLLLNFPDGFEPNKSQVKILKEIDKCIDNKVKFIIVNAPTGSGKSFISKSVANATEDPSAHFVKCVDNYTIFGEDGPDIMEGEGRFGCYTLTITKSLQDQYYSTFRGTGLLKGQSNYECALDETLSVDVAPCIYVQGLKQDCCRNNKCYYYNARNDMLKKKFSTLNYSMFFSLPDHLKQRSVIVCDEGSELEEQLVGQFSCEVDIPFLMKTNTTVSSFPVQETPKKVVAWLNDLILNLITNIEEHKKEMKKNKGKPAFFKLSSDYSKLSTLLQNIQLLVYTYYDSEYIIEKEDKKIKFTPLKVDQLSQQIFAYADTVIIMSATIIDPPNFCKTLGIKDYKYIEIDTEFEAEKAPILVNTKQRLNYGNLNEMLPKLARQVEELLDEHPNEKGIIHTHTQYIANYIRDNVKSDRLLCREPGVKNEEILDMHERATEPTVLVSPSMTYGVDLKGKLGQFQIILKAPWLPTGDKRVKKMMALDKQWYTNKMLCTFIQACGRIIRSLDDEGITYVLDGSIYHVIKSNTEKLPKYFIERFQ